MDELPDEVIVVSVAPSDWGDDAAVVRLSGREPISVDRETPGVFFTGRMEGANHLLMMSREAAVNVHVLRQSMRGEADACMLEMSSPETSEQRKEEIRRLAQERIFDATLSLRHLSGGEIRSLTRRTANG